MYKYQVKFIDYLVIIMLFEQSPLDQELVYYSFIIILICKWLASKESEMEDNY